MTTPTPAEFATPRFTRHPPSTATQARMAVERLIVTLAESITDDDGPIDLETTGQVSALLRQAAALTAAQADHIRALNERYASQSE